MRRSWRRALALAAALAAACGHGPSSSAATGTLDVRDGTAEAAALAFAAAAREPLVIDTDTQPLARCARVTVVSQGPRPLPRLRALLDGALRPSGLVLRRDASGLSLHRTPGIRPPDGCGAGSATARLLPPLPHPPLPPPPFPPPPLDPPPDVAAIVDGITDEGDGRYRLAPAAADALSRSSSELMREVRVVPELRDGVSVGTRLFGIRRGSVISALGFQNGDTVRTVNGRDVTSPDQALEAYASLRGAPITTVVLERRGAPTTLHYRVAER